MISVSISSPGWRHCRRVAPRGQTGKVRKIINPARKGQFESVISVRPFPQNSTDIVANTDGVDARPWIVFLEMVNFQIGSSFYAWPESGGHEAIVPMSCFRPILAGADCRALSRAPKLAATENLAEMRAWAWQETLNP
jgi:hypothetical protein